MNHFIHKFTSSMDKPVMGFSGDAMDLLQRYGCPGNVREVESTVEGAMVVSHDPELQEKDFTLRLPTSQRSGMTVEEVQRGCILEVIDPCGGNQSLAAQMLGIDRVTPQERVHSD